MGNTLRVFAPATVGNVACGFDIFGFALDVPGDEIVIRQKGDSVRITAVTGDGGKLPLDPEKNVAAIEAPIFSISRRAIYARTFLKAGTELTQDHLLIRRPAGPLSADQVEQILGKKTQRDIPAGDPISPADVIGL